MTDTIHVILNAGAGTAAGSDDIATAVRAAFAAHAQAIALSPCADGKALVAAAADARHSQPAVMVAGGGDGTVATVATQLVDGDTALGVLPLGTLNHFAKDLGIPLELDPAVGVIAAGHRIRVDVGELRAGGAHAVEAHAVEAHAVEAHAVQAHAVEPQAGGSHAGERAGRVFLNNSSLGLYPRIVNARDDAQHRLHLGKWPALARASWQALRDSHSFDLRLEVDGETLQRRTPFVFIGNNRYTLQGFAAGSRPRLDEGVLSIYVLRPQSLFGFLRLAVRALLGRVSPDQDFEAFTAAELLVESSRAQVEVALDGEVVSLDTPLRYRVRPRALTVLVPVAASDDSR